LQDESVRKELDLVDEQVTKLTDLATRLREDIQAQFQGVDFGSFRDLSEEERNARMAEIRAKTDKITADAQKEIDAVLLPHQRERLKQLGVQSQMRFGADRALSGGTLAEELGITDEQKEKLAAKQQEIQAGLQEKIAKLQAEARDELFSVLTSEQQAKLKAMIGKPFTFTAGGFGGGGGFGTQGGRGGDGGGRGRGRGDGGTRLQRPANGD
jgi:Spy/CpxP family protein refolding chaperone